MPYLGYEKYQEFKGGISWRHECGTYLVFVQINSEALRQKVNDRNAAGLNHIAFCGRDKSHLDELAAELESRGIKVLKIDDEHLCFEDSEKFAVEVFLP